MMQSYRLSAPFFVGTVFGIIGSAILLSFAGRRSFLWESAEIDTRPTEDVYVARSYRDAFDASFPSEEPSVATDHTILSQRITSSGRTVDKRKKKGRKVFIDCGANIASSVDLFLDTYPNAGEYKIYSFEIDASLRPYFSAFSSPSVAFSPHHRLFCPAAVSDDGGNATAYLQGSWTEKDRLQDGKEMHWGGGTLHAFHEESISRNGGRRNLAIKVDIPTINLSQWILRTFSKRDFVILKLDIEGSEYRVLRSLLTSKAFKLIDKLYGEMHEWAPLVGVTEADWKQLKRDLFDEDIHMLQWEADSLFFADMESLSPPVKRPSSVDGQPGELLATCRRIDPTKKSVGVSIAIGMNPLPAMKLIATIESFFRLDPRWSSLGQSRNRRLDPRSNPTDHSASSNRRRERIYDDASNQRDNGDDGDEEADEPRDGSNDRLTFPVTIFLYSDFVQLFPDLVLKWSKSFAIGSRGQRPHRPAPYFSKASYRKSLIAASNAFRKLNLDPFLLLSDAWLVSPEILDQARERGLSVVRPTITFPPFYMDSPMHLEELYYQVRSVERTPKALRFINEELKAEGGILTLDADQEDAFLISVFLLRFLNETSHFDLIPLNRCF